MNGGTDDHDGNGVPAEEDPIAEEAFGWFVRVKDNPSDIAVQEAFRAWLSQDPRHEEEYRQLQRIWGAPEFEAAVRTLPVARERREDATAPAPPARSWRSRRALPIAAMAAAILVCLVGAWSLPGMLLYWRADFVTDVGDRQAVSLPDGSTMVLDTASAAAIDFAEGRRSVRLLSGEAFFDVRHDTEHPFRVAGKFSEVTVTGTAFSVRLEADDDRIVLESGHVEVARLDDRADRVDLDPGEMILARAGALSDPVEADPTRLLAWRDGRVVFENRRFADVVRELDRYLDGRIIVADQRADQLTITGNYRLDDIDGAVRSLADAAGLSINRLPGGIIILL
ncbi:FecR domain-containing protein [Amorphus sp. 3PC139-8]|uniref:FecR family protein n=1 Tax=Amorphus sp. 3PC139-8 TaxID=2735676 RepID=UPI00345CD09C